MAKIIRARYKSGVLKLLEKLDLEESEAVTVKVERIRGRKSFGEVT